MQILLGNLDNLEVLRSCLKKSFFDENSNSLFIDPDYPDNISLIMENWPSVIEMVERLSVFVSENHGGILFTKIPSDENIASCMREARSM